MAAPEPSIIIRVAYGVSQLPRVVWYLGQIGRSASIRSEPVPPIQPRITSAGCFTNCVQVDFRKVRKFAQIYSTADCARIGPARFGSHKQITLRPNSFAEIQRYLLKNLDAARAANRQDRPARTRIAAARPHLSSMLTSAMKEGFCIGLVHLHF
jgi:hypothetical protein